MLVLGSETTAHWQIGWRDAPLAGPWHAPMLMLLSIRYTTNAPARTHARAQHMRLHAILARICVIYARQTRSRGQTARGVDKKTQEQPPEM